MASGLKKEREFLIDTAVDLFNRQYKRNIVADECTIVSIRPNYGCKYGYEIDTKRVDDNLRLRLYFNLEDFDAFGSYRLEVDENMLKGRLGDEVYVVLGRVNRYYVDSGTYKFRPIGGPVYNERVFKDMDDVAMQFMDGDNIEFIDATV